MRFLADENFPRGAVQALEAAGHDVVWVRLAAPGSSDTDILAAAIQESRIVLTFDKDFGELVAQSTLPPGCGVILFRLPPPRTPPATRRLAIRIGARDDWGGNFSVIEPGRVRMRRIR